MERDHLSRSVEEYVANLYIPQTDRCRDASQGMNDTSREILDVYSLLRDPASLARSIIARTARRSGLSLLLSGAWGGCGYGCGCMCGLLLSGVWCGGCRHLIFSSIFIGGGCDEIMTDHGIHSKPLTPQSCLRGVFPQDLSTVFPWTNFYKGTQRVGVRGEGAVCGSHGVAVRCVCMCVCMCVCVYVCVCVCVCLNSSLIQDVSDGCG